MSAMTPLAADPTIRRAVSDPARLQRVLLVKLSALGDVVHALPLADALRAALPDTFLAWAVRDRFAPLLEGNPSLDAVIALEGRGARDLMRMEATLRRQNFDAALDTQGLLVSGIVARLSGAPLRVGLDRNREGNALFLTHAVVPARHRAHMVDKLLGFCDALGLRRTPPRRQAYLADAEAACAAEMLAPAGNGPRAGLIVGASTPDKMWPVERWAELARRLAGEGVRPVLLGGPGEREIGEAVSRAANGAVALSLIGQTPLRPLASVLARCAVVVGGDSGPTHLSVAVGAPVVGLYGVTDPARTGPGWGSAPAVVLDRNDQAPPETRRPRHSAVPDALARIPAADAAEAALALLRDSKQL